MPELSKNAASPQSAYRRPARCTQANSGRGGKVPRPQTIHPKKGECGGSHDGRLGVSRGRPSPLPPDGPAERCTLRPARWRAWSSLCRARTGRTARSNLRLSHRSVYPPGAPTWPGIRSCEARDRRNVVALPCFARLGSKLSRHLHRTGRDRIRDSRCRGPWAP